MTNIFFVHDQQESPHLRASLLEAAGYKVVLMQSGSQCMELMAQRVPDLVILDVLLVGKHGFDVCRQIRRQQTAQDLPIVMCSDVYRSRPFREEAHNAGAQAFLIMPLAAGELIETVAKLVKTPAAPGAK